ncbi:MAG: hypothetical protein M3O35_16570, partial [Acidobacteriota bacterium]|nr:hypothetical protein [Acidobacteriota bacterium]
GEGGLGEEEAGRGAGCGPGGPPHKKSHFGGGVVAAGLMGGAASGTLVVNGHVAPLKYAYAITTAEANVRLVVCDVPMSEKELRDDFGLFELKSAGKINAIEVSVPNNSYSIWSKLSEGSISGSGNVEVFKASAKTAERIEGSMEVAAGKVGQTTYEFHFTAATEILKRAVEARPTADDAAAAATKEQTRVYLAYVRAIQAGNKAALQKVLIPENAQKVDSPDFPQIVKMIQSMTPKQIKVWKVVEESGEATLTVSGMEEGKQVWGSVDLVNIDGRWLIEKERWGEDRGRGTPRGPGGPPHN